MGIQGEWTLFCRAQQCNNSLEEAIAIASDALPLQLEMLADCCPEPRIACLKVAPVATIKHVVGQWLRRVVHDNEAGERLSTTLFKRCAVGRAPEQGSHLAPHAPVRRRTAASSAVRGEIRISARREVSRSSQNEEVYTVEEKDVGKVLY